MVLLGYKDQAFSNNRASPFFIFSREEMTEKIETREALLAELNEFSRLLAQLHEAREESRRAEDSYG